MRRRISSRSTMAATRRFSTASSSSISSSPGRDRSASTPRAAGPDPSRAKNSVFSTQLRPLRRGIGARGWIYPLFAVICRPSKRARFASAVGDQQRLAEPPESPTAADGEVAGRSGFLAAISMGRFQLMATKALNFDVGDYVVYPKHGVGRVIELQSTDIAGMELELYVLRFEK